jgi:hypothetical protein
MARNERSRVAGYDMLKLIRRAIASLSCFNMAGEYMQAMKSGRVPKVARTGGKI